MVKNKIMLFIFLLIIVILLVYVTSRESIEQIVNVKSNKFKIISSTENGDIESLLMRYAENNNIDLQIDYAGTIDIMDKINSGEDYDAVFCSNSIWLYMLKNKSIIKDSKSISINPIVFGIKKSKAEELGFTKDIVYTRDIVQAIREDKLNFIMSSATRTNSGASAYLAFLSTLAGNPEVLTDEILNDITLKQDLIDVFSGVQRSSGSEEFLIDVLNTGRI